MNDTALGVSRGMVASSRQLCPERLTTLLKSGNSDLNAPGLANPVQCQSNYYFLDDVGLCERHLGLYVSVRPGPQRAHTADE